MALLACSPGSGGPGAVVTPTTSANPVEKWAGVFEADDDILTVAIREPGSLDPMRAQDPAALLIARQLYEGLTRWDPVEERVLPAAAESWTVSSDGTEFTFRLRPGQSFHDDSPLTARDFKYAFERIALKDNAAELAYVLEPVEGFPLVNQLGVSRHLSGIRVLDESTLQIRTSEPFFELPAVLTHPGLVPVPRHAVEEFESFATAPVGNGPFRVAHRWIPGDPVLLRPFLGWPDTPELDGIAFVPYPSSASSWIEWLDGNIHVAEVPAGQIETAREIATDRGFVPLLALYAYGVSVEALPNVQARRAINHAIDRRTISATIFKGTLEPARGIVPSGMPGFVGNACLRLCRYAPEAARATVDRLPDAMRSLTVAFSGGGVHARMARAVADDLENVGFDVRLKQFGFDRYLEAVAAEEHPLYRFGWIAEYPTPGDFLSALFTSDSKDNYSGFASARVDELLARARAESSDSQRTSLYQEAERVILAQSPIVPIGTYVNNWAARPEVIGIIFDQMGGFDAAAVSLAND